MLYYLSEFSDSFGPLRVFQHVTPRAAGACLTAFLISVLVGNWVIRKLTALKLGQPIRSAEEVHKLHELHQGKGGTPTMGGILILTSILFSSLLWAKPDNPFIIALLYLLVVLGFLGFMDDYRKVTKKNSEGVSATFKLIVQGIGTVGAASFLYFYNSETQDYLQPLYVPSLKNPLIPTLGVGAIVFFTIVMVGGSNAVNLTDGLDGLAIGCMIVASMSYAVFAYVSGHIEFSEYLLLPYHPQVSEVTVFCMAMVGAGAGFLWFNAHPATVFMGDTGSLSLGGLIGLVAVCCRQELLLIVIGGVFVMEALSVILQVGSFKMTGKRIFRMAPIHHHFELKGWSENKVITRFWILAIMFALAGLATLKIR
ncbi:MAG: phospho-N-acetylmuramoyl-pentapeptide-transferase [Verrucomicrobiota bacterium]